jgi:effector-binding domain-containing protein
LFRNLFAVTFMFVGGTAAMAIEEAKYTVVVKEDKFEIRDYAPHILAETVVEGDLEGAGNKAFNRLFQYISGNNRTQLKVDMTAPVSQEPTGEKIAMTAPVGQQRVENKWAISFMMPASFTLETLPEPLDTRVRLRAVPARRVAVVRYSGFWSKSGYLNNKAALESWIEKMGLTIVGEPVWARYNAPFSLWFLRRNEVLIPVAGGE